MEDFFPLILGLLKKIPVALSDIFDTIVTSVEPIFASLFEYLQFRLFGLFLKTYWENILILAVILSLGAAHLFFGEWKKKHLYSYGVVEIILGVFTVLSVLPLREGLSDVNAYIAALSMPVNLLKVLGGIYISVRGQEDRRKGLEQNALVA